LHRHFSRLTPLNFLAVFFFLAGLKPPPFLLRLVDAAQLCLDLAAFLHRAFAGVVADWFVNGHFIPPLVRVALLPFFKIYRFVAWFLLLFRWSFPGLIRLLHRFWIGPFAGIVCGSFFAHEDTSSGSNIGAAQTFQLRNQIALAGFESRFRSMDFQYA
jgi:hypothetical protein